MHFSCALSSHQGGTSRFLRVLAVFRGFSHFPQIFTPVLGFLPIFTPVFHKFCLVFPKLCHFTSKKIEVGFKQGAYHSSSYMGFGCLKKWLDYLRHTRSQICVFLTIFEITVFFVSCQAIWGLVP